MKPLNLLKKYLILLIVFVEPEIVLFVSTSLESSVTTPSIAIETLSADTEVVIPEPPSKVKVSPKSTAEVWHHHL